MEILNKFLNDELSSVEMYEDIINFITSYHIRSDEFEGNRYIIKKMDQVNFIIFAEDVYTDGHREISNCISLYKNQLISAIETEAKEQKYI